MFWHFYNIYGTGIAVTSSCPRSLSAVDDVLSHFRSGPENVSETCRITVDIIRSSLLPPTAIRGKLVGRMPEFGIEYREIYPGTVHITYPGRGYGLLHFRDGHYILALEDALPISAVGLAVLAPVRFLLSQYRLLLAHAAAVKKDDTVVLLVGWSGSGKTTATLVLIRSGYECYSDDHTVLRMDKGVVTASAFPEPVGLTPHTRQIVPNALTKVVRHQYGLDGKIYVAAQDIYKIATDARPVSMILFPRIDESGSTRLVPISPSQAMAGLLAANGTMLLDQACIRNEVFLWNTLVKQAPAYQLRSGRDINTLPKLLADVSADLRRGQKRSAST